MRAEAGIQEIHPRRLDDPFQRVVGIGLNQRDNVAGYENRQPLFCRRSRDARLLRQHVIIHVGRRPCRYDLDEMHIRGLVRHLAQIPDVPAEIGVQIGLKVQSSVDVLKLIQAGHGALEDALKNFCHRHWLRF